MQSSISARIAHYFVFDKNIMAWDDAIPLILPIAMYTMTGASLGQTIAYWLLIVMVASFSFGAIGLNAAHHHPEITHEGDAIRPDTDWGIFQLDTVMDRRDIKGSPFLVLTHFGEHSLHHLFPTLDHAILPLLSDILMDTLEQFEYEVRDCSWFEHIIGQHRQLARTTTKTELNGLRKRKRL